MLSDSVASESSSRLLTRTHRVLLELSTAFYFFARNSAIPLVQQYVYHLVARKYNLTQDIVVQAAVAATESQTGATNGTESPNEDTQESVTVSPLVDAQRIVHQVSEESSLIIVYLTIAELLPAAIIVLFLGSWSDATGKRKFLMWLPCLGNAIYALGFLVPWYVSGADVDRASTMAMFVTGCVCSGLSGTVPGFLSGNASYISDTDSPRRRTLRLAIVELSIGATFAISSLMNGYWIGSATGPAANFEQPFWFVVVCSLVPFVIIFFLLREPDNSLITAGQVDAETLTYFRFRNLRGIRRVFGCSTFPQRKLWAIIIAFQVYVFVQQGQERTIVLFLQSAPLRCDPTQIGLQLFVLYGLAALGSWPGVPLMQRILTDLSIASVAMLSKMAGSLILVVANTLPIVYVSSVVQLFHLTPYAVARSLASQQMGEDEQGSVYALIHSIQSLVAFLGPLVHTTMFTATVKTMSGAVFLMSGSLLVIPILLFVYTRYLERREEGYSDVDGANKPFSPSSLTPLSETDGFAQRNDLRGY